MKSHLSTRYSLSVAFALAACCAPATPADAGFTTPVGVMGHSNGTAAQTFSFDLTTSTLPSGLTMSRTGATLYPARSASTVATVTGADVYEDRGDGRGGGHWTFDAYSNPCSLDFVTSSWTNSGATITASIGLGPDGATQGSRINDTSAVDQQYLYCVNSAASTDQHRYSSMWIRDSAVSPVSNGAVAASGGGNYGTALTAGSAWHRVSALWNAYLGATLSTQLWLYPAGAVPVPRGNTITLDPTQTGAIEAWGAQSTGAAGDVPLAVGTTSAAALTVNTPAQALLANGDLYLEGAFLFQGYNFVEWESPAWTLGNQYAVSIATANGEQGIFWGTTSGTWKGEKGNGTTTSGISLANHLYFDHELRWEFWNRPTAGGGGVNLWFNGCRFGGAANITGMRWTAVPQATPTAIYLGSKIGAANSFMPAPQTMLRRIDQPITGRRSSTDPEAAEGVILGDSIEAAIAPAGAMTGAMIYTFAEGRSRLGIVSYAVSGDTVLDQKSAWDGGSQRGRSDMKWVIIALGTNDIAGSRTEAQIATDLNSLVADINTSTPGAKIFLSPLTPQHAALTTGQYAIWQAVNADIAGTGTNPITGTNLVRLGAWTALNDGSDNLLTQYSAPFTDNVHPNDLGRSIMASAFRSALVTAGLL